MHLFLLKICYITFENSFPHGFASSNYSQTFSKCYINQLNFLREEKHTFEGDSNMLVEGGAWVTFTWFLAYLLVTFNESINGRKPSAGNRPFEENTCLLRGAKFTFFCFFICWERHPWFKSFLNESWPGCANYLSDIKYWKNCNLTNYCINLLSEYSISNLMKLPFADNPHKIFVKRTRFSCQVKLLYW